MALADIPFLGAYEAQRQRNRQQPLADMQQVAGVQGLLANMQKQQEAKRAAAKAQAYEAELAALGPTATPEQRIAVASKYATPDKLMTVQQQSLDRQATTESTRAMREATLAQQARGAEMMHEYRLAQAKTAEERAAETARHNRVIEGIQSQIATIRGEANKTKAPSGYRLKPDGSLEPIPGGPADMKAQASEGGRRQISEIADGLAANYDKLQKMGALVDPKRSAVKNVWERAAASGPGQMVAGAVGTEAQAIRDQINQARPLLLAAIKQATGMSAQQMNSNTELQFYLQAATDPTRGFETNRAALAYLDKTYGLGTGVRADQADIDALRSTAPRTRASGQIQPVAPGGAGGWSIRPLP